MPQGDDKSQMVRKMFDAIAPRYDLVNRIMTFRLDTRWRRRAVRDLALPANSVVLDLAAGTGDLCIDLRRAHLRPIAIDLSFGMGGVEGLTAAEVKEYIRYIADRRLIALGLKGIFKRKKNPLPWVEEMINAPTHTNFFENRATDYAKGALSGNWNDVWA